MVSIPGVRSHAKKRSPESEGIHAQVEIAASPETIVTTLLADEHDYTHTRGKMRLPRGTMPRTGDRFQADVGPDDLLNALHLELNSKILNRLTGGIALRITRATPGVTYAGEIDKQHSSFRLLPDSASGAIEYADGVAVISVETSRLCQGGLIRTLLPDRVIDGLEGCLSGFVDRSLQQLKTSIETSDVPLLARTGTE